ncbi:MAG: DUF1636 domain-containing protein [Betaproteobacteria bacterium]|nr:DUF1636 domain-containing protein [Betaproteobacteria bacterium]
MSELAKEYPVLSVCLTCRDGREQGEKGVTGGARLAGTLLPRLTEQQPQFCLRGVRCMSQCKRPCVAALCAPGRFSYMFGDLDPNQPAHVTALIDLLPLYMAANEGFLPRQQRPEPLRERIVGRLPPPVSGCPIVRLHAPAWAAESVSEELILP